MTTSDMTKLPSDPRANALLEQYGELIGGPDLMRCFGIRSARSFQRSAQLNQLPVATFVLSGRRGRYARTRDVVQWLNDLGRE